MVINENGLITENQNTQEYTENLSITQETSDFDLNSNNDSNIKNSMNTSENNIFTNNSEQLPVQEKQKETVETNCLALTVSFCIYWLYFYIFFIYINRSNEYYFYLCFYTYSNIFILSI